MARVSSLEGEEAEGRVVDAASPSRLLIQPCERQRSRRVGTVDAQGRRASPRGRYEKPSVTASDAPSQQERRAGRTRRRARGGDGWRSRAVSHRTGPRPSSTSSTLGAVDDADRSRRSVDHREAAGRRRRARAATSTTWRVGRDRSPATAPPSGGRITARARQDLGPRHVAGELGDVGGRPARATSSSGVPVWIDPAVLHDGDAVGEADRLVEVVGDEDDGLLAARSAGAGTRPASRGGSADRAPRTARRGTRAPGSTASERAMPTRCCWPPESWRGKSSSRPPRPTSSIISRARASRSPASTPWTSSGKATLPSTVRCGSSAKCWNTMPIWCRRSSISSRSEAASRFAAVEEDLAGGRLDQPRQAAHQRRLAGAGEAHDDEDLAGADVER